MEKIRTTKVPETGKDLYVPWKAQFKQVSIDNIVKMWHTIQSSFQLMEKTAVALRIKYNTVAMFRSDVVYVTPIDIRDTGSNATIPGFGRHPVSDRSIYGPFKAVKIWATERFSRLEQHAQYIQKHDPGWGIHSERFVNATLLPLIREIANVREHPTLCFLRARADETVWISDCEGPNKHVAEPSIMENLGDVRTVLEQTLGRKCPGNITELGRRIKKVDCSRALVQKGS
jgi:hypothetical protein